MIPRRMDLHDIGVYREALFNVQYTQPIMLRRYHLYVLNPFPKSALLAGAANLQRVFRGPSPDTPDLQAPCMPTCLAWEVEPSARHRPASPPRYAARGRVSRRRALELVA